MLKVGIIIMLLGLGSALMGLTADTIDNVKPGIPEGYIFLGVIAVTVGAVIAICGMPL